MKDIVLIEGEKKEIRLEQWSKYNWKKFNNLKEQKVCKRRSN